MLSLNQVRDRAFGVGVATIVTTNQSALRDIIIHERRVELALENHRWHDLVRTGTAIAVMNAHGNFLKQRFGYLSANAYNVTDAKLLYPIPQAEIYINPDLYLNP